MKNLKFKHLFLLLSFVSTISYASEADSLNKIGDNLDLFAVLETFKNSNSIKTFEEKLNTQNKKINNLDLNEDGYVDYIQVIDNAENNSHAIILRIDINEKETQDIAVIEIEKTNENTASIQIVGDIDLYGLNYLVEPKSNENKTESILKSNAILYLNVWHWHPIQHLYSPSYVLWISPYRWNHHPHHWKTWKPYQRHTYYSFHKPHHHHYYVAHHHHSNHAHKLYQKHRKHSIAIKKHHNHHSNHKVAHKTNTHKPGLKQKKSVKHTKIKKQQSSKNKPHTKIKKQQTNKKKATPKKGKTKRK